MDVLIGLDNVQDAFYPYGDYDLLDAWRLAVLNAHLDPDTWLDSITTLPARVLGLPERHLAVGAPADFLHLVAPSPAGLVTDARATCTTWRAGRPLSAPSEPIREPA
jgi:cytosine deaminase